jgi:hypothetical protein
MKTYRNYIIGAAIVCFAAITLMISGCKKDKEEIKDAPALPPKSGFVMNFDDFSNPNDTLKSTRSATTYNNWGYSYLNVVWWNALLNVGLAVPVASFGEAFNHEAVYHPDAGNWTWSYNVTVAQGVYEAELTGSLVADSVLWEMRITKDTEFSDFLWYYGKSDLLQTGGYWILKESPANQVNLLKIDWSKHSDGTSDIRYTDIKPGDAGNGTYIFYGSTLAELDRFYKISGVNLDISTDIEWSSTAKNGHVKGPHHYQNSDWHCWDETLQDIVCP